MSMGFSIPADMIKGLVGFVEYIHPCSTRNLSCDLAIRIAIVDRGGRPGIAFIVHHTFHPSEVGIRDIHLPANQNP